VRVTQWVSFDFRQFSKPLHTDLRIRLDLICNFGQGLPGPRTPFTAYTQPPHIINSFVKGENHVSSWHTMRKDNFFHQGL